MEDEWTKVMSGGRLVKFTYSDLQQGGAFLTAQIAGHEVVYSVILRHAERPFDRTGVERHFACECPLGAEVRCDVDGEMRRTKASRDLGQLLDAADAWKAVFLEKGWSQMKKRTAWEETMVRWLPVVFPALAEHARRLAQGERGVLFLTIDTAEMQRMLSTPGTTTVILDPAWHPAAGFIKNMSDPAGVGPEAAGRWAAMINIMDPARDVALLLASPPDADDGWFSRFLVTHDGSVPMH